MTNIYDEVANVYFPPDDSSKKPGGAKCQEWDGMVKMKGMDGTGLKISDDRPQALRGGLLLKEQLHLPWP